MGTALIDELTITEGREFLTSYKWNTKVAEHYFCKICGINTHHKRRSDPNQYGYNIGCIEGFEMSWIDNAPFVDNSCLLYTSPSPRDGLLSRMPSSA